jgi:Icc-related predicted phosphoesterase
MRVVATSDWHGTLPPDVPRCDLLIVAGDVLHGWGTAHSKAQTVWGWLERQPAGRIVGVAGNHDFDAETNPDLFRAFPWTFLQDEQTVVDGVKVWGSPWTKQFGSWAFMLPDHDLAEKWTLIPDDTEILVVHGPAYGILDKVYSGERVGSHTLRDRIRDLKDLRLLVTGHIHEAHGQTAVPVAADPFGCAPPRWFRAVNPSQGFLGRMNPAIVVDL